MVTSQPHPFLVSLMITPKHFRCQSCRASQDPGWKSFNDPRCTEFHASGWRRGEENRDIGRPGTVIEVPQRLWRFFGLQSTNGKIFVREEYPGMYERMSYAAEHRERENIPGVAVTGQPGIGTPL